MKTVDLNAKQFKAIAVIVFLLLGVLFGMQIMSFIFGNLGSSSVAGLSDLSATTVNETGAWLNSTGYTIRGASNSTFNGNVVLTAIWAAYNSTTVYNISVPLTNGTVTSSGVVSNATVANQSNVSLSYTYNYLSSQEVAVKSINNNSLNGIASYTSGASNQMSIVLIVITLILLVVVFAFFWNVFVGSQGGKKEEKAMNMGA